MQLAANERRFTLTTSRGDFAAMEAVPAGDPIGTALLIHGFTGSKEDFIHVLPTLANLGWRAVAVDQRGCYETTGSEVEADYILDEFAADLTAIVASFEQPIHLLGHSFGGLVTQAAAIAGANLATLTLFCSGPGAIPGDSYDWLKDFQIDLRAGKKADRINNSIAEMKADGRLSNPSVEEFLRNRWSASKTAALLGKAQILIDQADLSHDVAQLAQRGLPVLVTHGEADDAWPIEQQKHMAEVIGAKYVIVPDSAHSPNVENVDGTTFVLDQFWRSQL
jgi:pimeloyl-ACP methyl ester carboxylesterase